MGRQIDGAVLRISAIVCTLRRRTHHMAPRRPRPRGRPRPRPRALPEVLKARLFVFAKIVDQPLTCFYPHRPVQSPSRGDHNPRGPGIRDRPRLPWLYRNSTEKRTRCNKERGRTGGYISGINFTSGSIAVRIALIITIHILLLLSTFSLSLPSLLLFTWSSPLR